MLLVFVIGIDQTDVYGGCVAVSALIQYFTLVAVMWMGAEALLMFQKLVIVFVQITTKFIIVVSLVCWCKYHHNHVHFSIDTKALSLCTCIKVLGW